jgi:hypothetical protein
MNKKIHTSHDCGRIGCGGVIRGSGGEWLERFANIIGYGNAYLTKLWGVLRESDMLGI